MQDWLFSGDGFICDVRTVGVLMNDGHVLLQREKNGDEYALPGGHIRIGETTRDGLIREFYEETGERVCCVRMLWTEECFFEWNGKQAHNLAYYYLLESKESLKHSLCDVSFPQEDNEQILLEWIPITDLDKLKVYPSFLVSEINCLNGPAKHFVSRE